MIMPWFIYVRWMPSEYLSSFGSYVALICYILLFRTVTICCFRAWIVCSSVQEQIAWKQLSTRLMHIPLLGTFVKIAIQKVSITNYILSLFQQCSLLNWFLKESVNQIFNLLKNSWTYVIFLWIFEKKLTILIDLFLLLLFSQ